MRTRFILAVAFLFSTAPGLLAKGDGGFQSPLSIISPGRPGAVTVHAGDLNHDGKLDLIVANGVASNQASGVASILVLLQNPSNRLDWKQVVVKVGTSSVFVQSADFDGDTIDDIVVADVGTTAYFIHSNGDGTFAKPLPVT